MTQTSAIGALRGFFSDLAIRLRSVTRSCATVLPYLFGMGEQRREVTEEYPDPISSRTVDDLPPRTRGLLFNDIDRCTGCRDCARICPTACIEIETEPGANANLIWLTRFNIDFGKCIFCGLCVEVCAPQSLVHTKDYECAGYRRADLVRGFGRGPITLQQRENWASRRRIEQDEEA